MTTSSVSWSSSHAANERRHRPRDSTYSPAFRDENSHEIPDDAACDDSSHDDTQCFLDFVELVGDSNKGVSVSLSTYPTVAQRLQLLQKEIAEVLSKRDGALVSTTEFQEFEKRIRALTPGIVPSEATKKSN
jgi:hypothetical protein